MMTAQIEKQRTGKSFRFGYLLAGLVVLRAWFNAAIPLMDKTEARYAEIARIMAETGNWVVPQIDYGIPFWAKPPLSSWLSAGGIGLLGSNEFAVRLPYLLVSIVMAVALGRYAKKSNVSFFLPAVILFTVPEFFLHAGVVSTDVMLSFSIAVVMLSFWEFASNNYAVKWGLLFFTGLAIGMLAKGPIVVILTAPPLVLWWLRFKLPFKKILAIPWLTGLLIIVIVAGPWYYLMEQRSPGFNDYFFVGEHFKRFFVSGWTGDKYGFPKQQPLGMIWVFLLLTTVPFIWVVLASAIRNFKNILADRWRSFLYLWLLWTPLFFSVSKSLIHPYVLPVMIPVALLFVYEWNNLKGRKIYLGIAVAIPVLMAVILVSGLAKTALKNNTDKYLLQQVDTEAALYSLEYKSYSSQFYSAGKIQQISRQQLDSALETKQVFAVLIDKEFWPGLANKELKKLVLLKDNKRKGIFVPKK